MPRIENVGTLLPLPREPLMARFGVNSATSAMSSTPLVSIASALSAWIEIGVFCREVSRRSALTMTSSSSCAIAAPLAQQRITETVAPTRFRRWEIRPLPIVVITPPYIRSCTRT
jgi:hypothetical protein